MRIVRDGHPQGVGLPALIAGDCRTRCHDWLAERLGPLSWRRPGDAPIRLPTSLRVLATAV